LASIDQLLEHDLQPRWSWAPIEAMLFAPAARTRNGKSDAVMVRGAAARIAGPRVILVCIDVI